MMKWLIIGIGGVTCGGKTTLANNLHKQFPNCSKCISQDDYYLNVGDPKLEKIPELNHYNFDTLSSLDMEKMFQDINTLINDEKILICTAIANGKLDLERESPVEIIADKLTDENVNLLIIEGFCIFNYKPVADLCDLKYYITLEKDECYKRRSKRIYEPPDVPGYFDKYVWPQYLQQKNEVKENIVDIRWFDKNTKDPLKIILHDILDILQK